MKSRTYVLMILLMFFLTLSCAHASENLTATDDTLLSIPVDDIELSSPIDNEILGAEPSINEINYDSLVIKDINFTGDSTKLNIEGFSQNGLVMSDFTMTITPAADSSKLDLQMKIPEVKYTDYNSTMFTFKNLDLSILPSSNPSALEFSVLMDTLDLVTGTEQVNLKDLNLFFKSYPEVNGVTLLVDIADFEYNDYEQTYLHFKNLDFDMALGMNGKYIDLDVILPTMQLITADNGIDMANLDLSIDLTGYSLADLGISAVMSDFIYTNFNDVNLKITDMFLSLEPMLDSTDFNSIIRMSTFDFTGINSSDFQFPGFNISSLDFENFTTGMDLSSVDLSGVISILDVSKMDLSSLVSYLSSGFKITTYTDNMPGQYKSSIDFNAIDLSSTGLGVNVSGFNLGSLFSSMNYSSLGSSVLNLTGLFESFGINVSDLGVNVSGYNLSAITISDISSIMSDPNFNMSAIFSKIDLSNLDMGGLNLSGLISSFNLTSLDLSAILALFNITDFDLAAFINGFDLQKFLNLFLKKDVPSNKTVPSTPVKQSPVKSTSTYVAQKTYTVTRVSDNQVICKSKFFILDYLNKLFNMTFINGHLLIYIDGELVFNGTTTDDLTQVLFEIIDKYLGEHEITVEFTDSANKTNTYKEKIMVE